MVSDRVEVMTDRTHDQGRESLESVPDGDAVLGGEVCVVEQSGDVEPFVRRFLRTTVWFKFDSSHQAVVRVCRWLCPSVQSIPHDERDVSGEDVINPLPGMAVVGDPCTPVDVESPEE